MFTFRRANADDVPTVQTLLSERLAWLRAKSIEQWLLDPNRNTAEWTRDGFTWVLEDAAGIVGTIAMSSLADVAFWTTAERRVPAYYLAKLATHPSRAGEGLGRLLNDCAVLYAAQHRVPRTRWDVWASNADLQHYYRSIGGTYLHTVPGYDSGALFEIAYRKPTPEQPVTIEYDTHTAATLRADAVTPTTGLDSPGAHGPQPRVRQWLDVQGLEMCEDSRPLRLSADAAFPGVLYNSGQGWFHHTGITTEQVRGQALARLTAGHVYRLHLDGNSVTITGDLPSTLVDASTARPLK